MQGRSPILALFCGTSWNFDSRERNYMRSETIYDQEASSQQQSQTCVVCQVACLYRQCMLPTKLLGCVHFAMQLLIWMQRLTTHVTTCTNIWLYP